MSESGSIYPPLSLPASARGDLPNVLDYGAKFDGVTDDTAAIQAGLNDASVAGLRLPGGGKTAIVSGTLTVPTGKSLLGPGVPGSGVTTGNDPHYQATCVLSWQGGTTVPFIQSTRTRSIAIDGFEINGNNKCRIGLQLSGVQSSHIGARSLVIRQFGSQNNPAVAGVCLWLEGVTTNATASNLQECEFGHLLCNGAQLLRLTHADGTAGDCCINLFRGMRGSFGCGTDVLWDGNPDDALFLDACDDNHFLGPVWTFRNFGTGYGLTFGTQGRNNSFLFVAAGPRGVHAMTPNLASWSNRIYLLNKGDGEADPTLDAGANLHYEQEGPSANSSHFTTPAMFNNAGSQFDEGAIREGLVRTAEGCISESDTLTGGWSNQATVTQGTIYGRLVGLRKGDVITTIDLSVATAAGGTDATLFRLGLATSAGVMLAVTNAFTTAATLSAGRVRTALTAPFTVTADGAYWLVFIQVGAFGTTQPQFLRAPQAVASVAANQQPRAGKLFRIATFGTGQVDLPAVNANLAAPGYGANPLPFYMAVS